MNADRGRCSGSSVGGAGFVLPAVAALLLVGSSVALLSVAPPTGDGADLERTLHATARLVAARDALLAYTAAYPDLYGPTGAGPGHLPCPDTDDTFRLAGPNPPCGGGRSATGRLPAHVTIGGRRAGIDVAVDGAPIRYRLVARVANNPARRPLSIEASANALDAPDVVAELSLPGRAGRPDAAIRLHAAELANAAERRVAAWVVARARVTGPAGPGEPTEPDTSDELDVNVLVSRRPASSKEAGDAVALVDGVPQARHWFVLDDWRRMFRASVAPSCLPAADVSGEFPAGASATAVPRAAPVACVWQVDATERRRARRRGDRPPAAELTLAPIDASTGEPRSAPEPSVTITRKVP